MDLIYAIVGGSLCLVLSVYIIKIIRKPRTSREEENHLSNRTSSAGDPEAKSILFVCSTNADFPLEDASEDNIAKKLSNIIVTDKNGVSYVRQLGFISTSHQT